MFAKAILLRIPCYLLLRNAIYLFFIEEPCQPTQYVLREPSLDFHNESFLPTGDTVESDNHYPVQTQCNVYQPKIKLL